MMYLGQNKIRIGFYFISLSILFLTCVAFDTQGISGLPTRVWESGHFFFIGLLAATIANATGAGGGVVFLPAFMSLGLSPTESVATSFAIQCFGMTSGALAWMTLARSEMPVFRGQWQHFNSIFVVCSLSSILGLLGAQWLNFMPFHSIHLVFAVFSILVALLILYRTFIFKNKNQGRTKTLNMIELFGLVLVCLGGGVITAWISVGVGELIAVVLLLFGFRVQFAIAVAVCVTSLTVISAVFYHLNVSEAINSDVLLFAAPAALIGGALAKPLATILGNIRLKLLMAAWLVISAAAYI
ncbi:MAG: sulfite exporter TauE/SafE family protein [Kangiellaceae bacterium]|nr:sulfite exporter TauE/SafE family protein [Kangiellaceae bacterium]MCW8999293.1 sulfite exporter TauE/SafE family protein [Kangiellaceae bacterium]